MKKNDDPTSAPAAEVQTLGEIYTMPRTNMSGAGSQVQATHPKNLLWLWVGLGAAAVLGGGLVVYFGYFKSTPPINTQPAPIVNDVNTNTQPAPEPTPVVTTTPAERDRQRYLDVKALQTALDLYFADRGLYPVAVSELQLGRAGASTLSAAGFSDYPQAPIYVSQLPTDPAPGPDIYYRYLSPAGTTYQLFFSLEEGIANLAAGNHYVGPAGFDGAAPIDPEPEETPSPSLQPPPASPDTDQDGLTDVEEALYGTAVDKQDSDADGYTDGSEVISGYNPALSAGARLYVSATFTNYNHDLLGFNFYYPATWTKQSLDAADDDVIFTSATNEFVQIVVQDNPDNLSPAQWYANNAPDVTVANVPVLTLGLISAARSLDGLNIYFNIGSRLISISYNLATHPTADYLTTWQAIYQSLALTVSE